MKINYFLLLVGLIVGASMRKRKRITRSKAVYTDEHPKTLN